MNTHLALSYVFGFQVQCKCYYDCKKIAYERKLQLFENLYAKNYKTQGTYLMGLLNLVKIKRRRHGKYETAVNSKRQTSVTFTIPNQDGHFVQVCRNTRERRRHCASKQSCRCSDIKFKYLGSYRADNT
nr:unnamed protein product [Callosobruchus chinensis]